MRKTGLISQRCSGNKLGVQTQYLEHKYNINVSTIVSYSTFKTPTKSTEAQTAEASCPRVPSARTRRSPHQDQHVPASHELRLFSSSPAKSSPSRCLPGP